VGYIFWTGGAGWGMEKAMKMSAGAVAEMLPRRRGREWRGGQALELVEMSGVGGNDNNDGAPFEIRRAGRRRDSEEISRPTG